MRCLTPMGSAATSSPVMRAAPAVGVTLVVRIPMEVVFPAPFGPRRPKISPRRTEKEMPSTALVWDLGYRLTRPVTSMANSVGGDADMKYPLTVADRAPAA